MKTKINYDRDGVTNFYDKKIPKKDSNHTSLAVIIIDCALKKDEKYYQQVYLKECEYIEKKLEIIWVIFLILMSLMKNKLEWVKFVCKSIATEPYNA